MQNETMFPVKDAQQGGILSPLLAALLLTEQKNICQMGLQRFLPAYGPGGHRMSKPNRRKKLLHARHLDDFLRPERETIDESAQAHIEKFVKPMARRSHETILCWRCFFMTVKFSVSPDLSL